MTKRPSTTFAESGDLPPIRELIGSRPARWQGETIEWKSAGVPDAVFLRRFRPVDGAEVFLFGARYELTDFLLDGEPQGDGHFVEYIVVARSESGPWTVHRLLQQRSVTFSEVDEVDDSVTAKKVTASKFLAGDLPPRWESPSEAEWPTHDGKPMMFLGQLSVPDSEATRTKFTWKTTVYLFRDGESRPLFKAMIQQRGEQSAENHYESEE
jgi:hypothetical protein